MRPFIIGTLSLCLFLGIYTVAHAQYENEINRLVQQLDVNISPKNPGPREVVKMNVRSNFFDIFSAQVVWKVNGVTEKSGLGINEFSFISGNYGDQTVIELTLTPPQGDAFSRFFVFSPGSVDLIWQARTYTPPFSRLKPLMSNQSTVTVVALPKLYDIFGKEIPKELLIFTWKVNDKPIPNGEGLGKHSIDVTGRFIRDTEKVSVTVYNQDRTVSATKMVTIRSQKPIVQLYELHPLFGVLREQNLNGSTYPLQEREVSIIAEPLYVHLDPGRIFPRAEYVWSLNGKRVEQESSNGVITLRNETGEAGQSRIDLSLTVPGKTLQTHKTGMGITFDE